MIGSNSVQQVQKVSETITVVGANSEHILVYIILPARLEQVHSGVCVLHGDPTIFL